MSRERKPSFEEIKTELAEQSEEKEGASELKPETFEKKEDKEAALEQARQELKTATASAAGELVKTWKLRKELGLGELKGEAKTLLEEVRALAESRGLSGEADKNLIEAVREAAGAYDAADIESLLRSAGAAGEAKTEVR